LGKYIDQFWDVTTTTVEIIDNNRISFYGNRKYFYKDDIRGNDFTKNGFYTVLEENGVQYLSAVWDDDKATDKYLLIGRFRILFFV
jgi:hypothetical protein